MATDTLTPRGTVGVLPRPSKLATKATPTSSKRFATWRS
jgi:hypothetical protein